MDDTFYPRPVSSSRAANALLEVRERYTALKADIERLVPPSRERSIALTELETSAMWATKAIVRHQNAEG